jgi:uncharacterized membrane protein
MPLTTLTLSLCLWGVFTVAFIFLVLCRAYLSGQDADRLFLSETDLHAHIDNAEIM